jgi:predicted nucleic acid-binding Zn ribbon protein
MKAEHRRSYRFTPEDIANMDRLRREWAGPFSLATEADVIRQALRLAVQALGSPPKKNLPNLTHKS